MIPIRDNRYARETPIVTWTLVGLNALIYIWDRDLKLTGPSVAFADLAMKPNEVTLALTGGGDPAELGKVFTAMFLHGNLFHLLGNLLFLYAFGPNVEAALGGIRYALFYFGWGFVAFASQIVVNPYSPVTVLGASGAIGGVLGAYFLLFPANKVKVILPPIVWMTFDIYAWLLLGLWFLLQVMFPQDGVATWAHAGGFVSGVLSVLVLGGPKALATGNKFILDEQFDES